VLGGSRLFWSADNWSDKRWMRDLFFTPNRPKIHKEGIDDRYDFIERFIVTHQQHYTDALQEIRSGKKRSCWSWYIIPTPPWIVDGEERGSFMNRKYALRTDDQAKAYLEFAYDGVNLRDNYLGILREIRDAVRRGVAFQYLLGYADAAKAKSSVEYFLRISKEMGDVELSELCWEVLELIE